MLLISTTLSAQLVGDGTPKPPTTASPTKATFTIKIGSAMPRSNFGITPGRVNVPQYASGKMGAKTGFFAEFGMGMNLTDPDKMVGFYYFPILATYWQSSLDWKSLGGFFTDKAIYIKPVSAIEIAQRYGIEVKPIKDLSVALYYRPGLIIPLTFEMNHVDVTKGEKFLFTGTMSTASGAPALMMSHTPGLAVKYMMATLSIEAYNAKPTFDIRYQDLKLGVDKTETAKIPIKMLLISLALSF